MAQRIPEGLVIIRDAGEVFTNCERPDRHAVDTVVGIVHSISGISREVLSSREVLEIETNNCKLYIFNPEEHLTVIAHSSEVSSIYQSYLQKEIAMYPVGI